MPLTPILCITSTLYTYEDGMDSKFQDVSTKKLRRREITQKTQYGIQPWRKFEIKISFYRLILCEFHFLCPAERK